MKHFHGGGSVRKNVFPLFSVSTGKYCNVFMSVHNSYTRCSPSQGVCLDLATTVIVFFIYHDSAKTLTVSHTTHSQVKAKLSYTHTHLPLPLLQLYCPNGIDLMGNSGCFPRGKPAATESPYPTYGACGVFVSTIHRTVTWTTGS